jgi:membrane protease YdiL (CAAX protease family)
VRGTIAVACYLLLLLLSLARLSQRPGFEAGETIAGMVVFGLAFSLFAFWATRGATPRPVEMKRPGRELAALAAYLVAFAVAFLGYGLSALRGAVPREPGQSVTVLAAKLAAMVLLPALVLAATGCDFRSLFRSFRLDRVERRALVVMGVLLLLLQLVAGRGPREIARLGEPAWVVALAAPLALVWMCLEAGLTEEFLFRAAFQTRAAAWLRSPTAGLVAMALVFGLAHAPGYVLRGAHAMEGFTAAPDPLSAAAYAVVVVSPIGLMFGVLWARTRSLLLVVLLHGWTDLVPNLADFVRTWRVGS